MVSLQLSQLIARHVASYNKSCETLRVCNICSKLLMVNVKQWVHNFHLMVSRNKSCETLSVPSITCNSRIKLFTTHHFPQLLYVGSKIVFVVSSYGTQFSPIDGENLRLHQNEHQLGYHKLYLVVSKSFKFFLLFYSTIMLSKRFYTCIDLIDKIDHIFL